jgi:hypothetical protein
MSAPAFLVVAEGRAISIALWTATLAALALALLLPRVRSMATAGSVRIAVLGAALVLLAAMVQAPTLSHAPILEFSRSAFNPGGVVSARFYYLPLVGFSLVAAVIANAIARAPWPRGASAAFAVVVGCALIGLLASSRSIARQWSHFTVTRSEVYARPAVDAVAALTRLQPGCRIYLLDLPPASDLFRDMIDTGVKKSLAPGHPALGCFIQSEHAPWYHLLARTGLALGAERPFEIIEAGGRPYQPLEVGNLVYYFVRIVPGEALLDDPLATFLAWRGDRFVDVTGEVRSRQRLPRFFDRRAP